MINSAREDVLQKVRPPSLSERRGASGPWDMVERRLGLQLPEDYKWFIATYGYGSLCGLYIYTPFTTREDRGLLSEIANITENLKRLEEKGYLYRPFFPRYPASGGLLPFATTESTNYHCWLTNGAPDTWPLVVYDCNSLKLYQNGYSSLAVYINDLLERRTWFYPGVDPMDADWFEPPLKFVPLDPDSLLGAP
jgi:hypothetical protein